MSDCILSEICDLLSAVYYGFVTAGDKLVNEMKRGK